jgi:hypothetical protein
MATGANSDLRSRDETAYYDYVYEKEHKEIFTQAIDISGFDEFMEERMCVIRRMHGRYLESMRNDGAVPEDIADFDTFNEATTNDDIREFLEECDDEQEFKVDEEEIACGGHYGPKSDSESPDEDKRPSKLPEKSPPLTRDEIAFGEVLTHEFAAQRMDPDDDMTFEKFVEKRLKIIQEMFEKHIEYLFSHDAQPHYVPEFEEYNNSLTNEDIDKYIEKGEY